MLSGVSRAPRAGFPAVEILVEIAAPRLAQKLYSASADFSGGFENPRKQLKKNGVILDYCAMNIRFGLNFDLQPFREFAQL
jgi:hypothetical protein